jgi:hypothetical protein
MENCTNDGDCYDACDRAKCDTGNGSCYIPWDAEFCTYGSTGLVRGGSGGTTRGPSKGISRGNSGPIDKYENEFGFNGWAPASGDEITSPGYPMHERNDRPRKIRPIRRPNRISDTEVGRIMSQGAYIGTILGLIGSYMYLGLYKDGTSKRDLAVSGAITLLGLGIGSYLSAKVVEKKGKRGNRQYRQGRI